ncbi:MAG TPA: AraC family transcriptional regulator [Clostridiales bacterium]|nr:AraC family transcriptional regulator [Clostridiales bacterium]
MFANLDSLNLKTKIGGLVFDIILDKRFFTPDMDNVVHKHKHSLYEFHYIAEGEGTVYINNSEYKVYPGCYFIVNSGVYHKQLQDNNNPIHKHCFKFEYKYQSHLADSFFPEEESKRIADILNQLDYFISTQNIVNDTTNHINNLQSFSHDSSNNSGKIISLIHDIQEELSSKKVGFYARIQCLFTQLFIFIVRDITLDKETNYSIPQKLPYEKRSALIEGFFDTHFNDNVTSDDLCKLLNLSTSQLNRILKKKYNSTFGQKLLEMRIEAAKRYLETTSFPISIIAEKVGYSSAAHFCNIFKDKCGITPGEYRASMSRKIQ